MKLIAILGTIGARADFVAGWLGTLPNFIDNHWRIDPETGKSFSYSTRLKRLDFNNITLPILLADYNYQLDQHAITYFAGSHHQHHLYQKLSETEKSAVTTLSIDITDQDPNFIHWEFLVKTFMLKQRSDQTPPGIEYGVDVNLTNSNIPISDQSRCDYINNFLATRKTDMLFKKSSNYINYSEIFVPGGSRIVADKLNIETSERHHRLWDQMIPLADAPKSITRFGRTWTFESCMLQLSY